MPITTIPFSARKAGPYMASAGQTAFSFGFPVLAAGDLTVWRERAGVVAQLVLDTHYAVNGVGEQSGGAIVLTSGAMEADIIAIDGTLQPERATGFVGGVPFKTAFIDSDLNRLAIMVQELARETARSVRRHALDENAGSLHLPKVSETALLALTAAGELIPAAVAALNVGAVSTFIATLLDDTTPAMARATLGIGQFANVKDYGAVGDGVTDDTVAFEDALASGNPVILISDGNFLISDTLTIPPTVHKIISSGTVTQSVDKPIWSKAGTVPSAGVAASGSYSIGDKTLNFPDASTFSEDDWVLVRTSDLTPNQTAGSRVAMLRRLTDATGTTISLDAALYRDISTDVTARIVQLGSRVIFEGGTYTSIDQANTVALFIFILCHAPDFRGVTIRDSGGPAIQLGYCVGGTFEQSHIINMLDNQPNDHLGYGVQLMGATRGFQFLSGTVGKVRHAITTTTFVDDAELMDAATQLVLEFKGEPEACYYGPVYCYATTNAALDTHEQGFGITITPNVHGCFEGVLIRAKDVHLHGGQIIGCRRNAIRVDFPASNATATVALSAVIDGTYVNVVGPDGSGGTESRGIHVKPEGAEVIVKNGKFIGFEQYGIHAVGGTVVKVSNSLFDGLTAAAQTALQIESDNNTVEDCIIRNCNIGIRETAGLTGNLFQFNEFVSNNMNESRVPTYPMLQASHDVGTWYALGKSAVAVSHTGDTNETTLATVKVPANAMGPNGVVRITTLWSCTNSANNKTFRVRFGGPAGTIYLNSVQTAIATFRDQRQIANRNAANSQVGSSNGLGTGGWATTTGAVQASTIDTTIDVEIAFRGQLANAGETISLESYLVEVLYAA